MGISELRKKENELNTVLAIIGANLVGYSFVLVYFGIHPSACVLMAVIGTYLFIEGYTDVP